MRLVSDNNKIMTKESFYAPEARILVVDDTRMNLIVIKGLLKQTGIQIDTADSGKECLFLAKKNKYHIIFLDIRMPEMDGIEALHRLLMLEENKNTPVIALTANDVSETKKEYINEGFSDYLSKPVNSDKLEQTILQYLPRELVWETMIGEIEESISNDEADEMPDIAGVDAAMGIRSCGTAEIFQKALREFYLTANERIQEIEHYLYTENYNDYTIKVHALKSSARLVGAKRLSEMAQYLEECGNRENIQEIKHKTVDLVDYYNGLIEAIEAYINDKENNHKRPVIEREPLMDALHTIYEFVEVFDFDSADSVMVMLDEYTIPDEYYEATQKLKVLLIDVDRDDIMRHINAMEEQAHSEPEEDCSIDIHIPDIDVKSALEALGGSVDEYINIMKVFTKDEKERIKQMDECIRTENIKLYTIYAHSLKSSTAIIGAMELSKLAELLEMAGKNGNLEYIHESHNEFLIKTNHIIENLLCFLRQCSSCENQEKEIGSKEFLIENLAKIEAALIDYEISIAEEALNRLNNMQWSKAISIMISEIGQKLLQFDYEEAQLLVVKLLEMEEK